MDAPHTPTQSLRHRSADRNTPCFWTLSGVLCSCSVPLGAVSEAGTGPLRSSLPPQPQSNAWTVPRSCRRCLGWYLGRVKDVKDVRRHIAEHAGSYVVSFFGLMQVQSSSSKQWAERYILQPDPSSAAAARSRRHVNRDVVLPGSVSRCCLSYNLATCGNARFSRRGRAHFYSIRM
jgi:hypothetical protein